MAPHWRDYNKIYLYLQVFSKLQMNKNLRVDIVSFQKWNSYLIDI